jgi:hypothetical protein
VVLSNAGASAKLADMNGDGALDLVVFGGSVNSQRLQIFLNDGGGNFALSKTLPFPDGGTYGSFQIADFNGDSLPDLAVYSDLFYPVQVRQIEIFTGSADGNFTMTQTVPESELIYSAAAFDLDHDGSPDLLTGGGATLHHNMNSAGTFGSELTNATGWNAGYGLNDRSIGDVNGDGCEDVTLYEDSVGVNVLYGQCGAPAPQSTSVKLKMKPSVGRGAGLVVGLLNTDKRGLEFTGLVNIKLTPADARVSPIYVPTGCTQSAYDNGAWSYDCLVVSLGAQNMQYFGFGFTSTAGTQHEIVKVEATVTAGGAHPVVLDTFKNPVPISVNGYRGH